MVLQRIYDAFRQYIMASGGDISKFFQEVDLNKDNFISKAEMKIALEKIGLLNLSEEDLN